MTEKIHTELEESHIPEASSFASKSAPTGSDRAVRLIKDTPANRALNPGATKQSVFDSLGTSDLIFYEDGFTKILLGDAIEGLDELALRGIEVDCIVTSPPFYGQRDYGDVGQIGLEEHPSSYIEKLVEVFEHARPVLRSTGSLWVNLGDTYWSGKGQHRSSEAKQSARRFGMRPQDGKGDGAWARPKQLLLIPHRFAIAMQDAGWLVRNDNVWVKPNPIPDQVRDRCSSSHEYMFHFTRERWYYFDRPSVGKPSSTGSLLPPSDTWVIESARGNGVHKATFSEELVRIPILGTTPPNGIVLDPFAGSGTSMSFARKHGLRSIGIDLIEKYCELAADGLGEVQ